MELGQRISHVEGELKLLKNEMKEVLMDLREFVLNLQNPFGPGDGELRARAPTPPPSAPRATAPAEPEGRGKAHAAAEPEGRGKARAREEAPGPLDAVDDPGEVVVLREPSNGRSAAGTTTKEARGAGMALAQNPSLDLHTLMALARWAERTVKRVGLDGAEAIVQLYELSGSITPRWRETLVKLLGMAHKGVLSEKGSVKESIAALVQLQSLIQADPQTRQLMFLLGDLEEEDPDG